ncbi:chemotaxis protein CheW [Roseateles sp. SL47]|uniref:chemotaxis protein CheW n=1 Tax=Roseateles sp. SL47 TaxID=2995138 RepID=UPI00226EF7A9|nr:chemotaxis protein CheW [Roseateles sp. SL47]WAC73022.1 chemotaxis protein CheW [Roseateles sp. SL47]
MEARREDNEAVLVCWVGPRLCAWPLDGVHEILRPRPLRTLTAPVAHVPGLARIRGRWLPVVDVASALHMPPQAINRLVVVHHDGQTAALGVSRVAGIQRMPLAAIERLPLLLQDERHGGVEGVATLNALLVALLDPARLMPTDLADRTDLTGLVDTEDAEDAASAMAPTDGARPKAPVSPDSSQEASA